MTASPFDSPLYTQLFPTGAAGRLFSDSAAIRAMLLVEGALAKAQGAQGVIPEVSAAAIHRAAMEVEIDPGALAASTGENGVPVPGFVAAFRAAMNAPEHAQYIHWGATSQDILDSGLMLRLRQCLKLMEEDLRTVLTALADAAETHADAPMPARTYGQQATPTTWGGVLAQWGMPLADALEELPALRDTSLLVSLSGAAGTSSALGVTAPAVRAAMAEALGLADPGRSWHTDRTPVLRIADWMGRVVATLGGMGSTLVGLTMTGVGEVSLGGSGASSTMPQKQNPVAPSVLLALSHQMTGLRAGLQNAAPHQFQRDGAAWFAEWLVLPQLCLTAASALATARPLAAGLAPNLQAMSAALNAGQGLIHAEALSFALADILPRPEAQAATKKLCRQAIETGAELSDLARSEYPDLPARLFDPAAQTGQAPAEARAFAARVRRI
ncbi:adenylosuccinate lyase family protein [Sulfitobacter sp. LCG007]